MQKIVLASGNRGKLAEIQSLLSPLKLTVTPQSEFAVPEADETGATFVENALLKARNAAAHTGLPALADDSGLAVDALGGAPGIYSARYAGEQANDDDNNKKLLAALDDLPEDQRGAQFHCCVVFLRSAADPTPLVCQGVWPGRILSAPRGEAGFGYDPLFWAQDQNMSAAELPKDVKNRVSHRGKAMALLMAALVDRADRAAKSHDAPA